MGGEVHALGKPLGTHITPKPLVLRGVGLHVQGVVGPLAKRLAAYLTLEGPLASVKPGVVEECALVGELGLTVSASKRLVSRV